MHLASNLQGMSPLLGLPPLAADALARAARAAEGAGMELRRRELGLVLLLRRLVPSLALPPSPPLQRPWGRG